MHNLNRPYNRSNSGCQNMQPIVNGVTSLTLTTSDRSLFDKTVDFYADIVGFSTVDAASTTVQMEAESGFTLLVVLDPEAHTVDDTIHEREALVKFCRVTDWRSATLAMCLQASDLNGLINRLRAHDSPLQISPNELFPQEIYTIDPMGTLIGFTGVANPMTLNPPVEKLTASKPKTSSSVPTSKINTGLHTPAAFESTVMSTVQLEFYGEQVSERRNIAVMTSGGDAPGMNANVRAVVRAAIFRGSKAFCVMEGYEGLVRGGPEYIKQMQWHDVRGFLSDGGTNIGTARCMAFKERKGRLQAAKNMIEAGIDALIVCGGDGSLTGADVFRAEWPGLLEELLNLGQILSEQHEKHRHLYICGTVGSIDNDMATTDATIGAYSSLARICRAIDYIDATANSHSRAFVVEVMGRHCGWLALMAGIATLADYIFIPEKPSSLRGWKEQMCEIVLQHRLRGKRKTIVIVAEGAITSELTPILANDVKDVLVDKLGLDTRVTTLGHVQRGGTAVAYDRFLATLQGVEAVKAVLSLTPDTPLPLIAVEENKIVRKPLIEAVKITKQVAAAIAARDFDKAMLLRDSEFVEHLNNFIAMNSACHNAPTLPKEKRKRIAVINIGAPAGGMNSAVYAMATYCMSRGHTPYAIYNGFSGLARHESVKLIDWLEIEGWNSVGGSELGTNRLTPEDTDLGMIAYYFDKYQFDGLILVGGFEAFVSLEQLEHARSIYPAFRIPMTLIPATISNNVPGTEYSLGADTCINALMDYCDIVKQLASSTRDRAFVIEVQGGNSGYIATHAALCVGAQVLYVPEEGIPLAQLELDIRLLKELFVLESGAARAGKLILKLTNASKVLTTEVLAEIFKLELGGTFDAKTAIPGHVQQGGIPTPIDRTRGARFAIRAVNFIEDHFDDIAKYKYEVDFPLWDRKLQATAAVLGIKLLHLVFSSIRKLYDFETSLGTRMPKKISWSGVRDISDELVGRCRITKSRIDEAKPETDCT